MADHTPGPWMSSVSGKNMRENYSQPFGVANVGIGPNGGCDLIAGCFGDCRGGEDVAKANASLIATAPELLAIAKRLIAIDEGVRHPEGLAIVRQELIADAKAVLARAVGE